jgi:hypothetical protein
MQKRKVRGKLDVHAKRKRLWVPAVVQVSSDISELTPDQVLARLAAIRAEREALEKGGE